MNRVNPLVKACLLAAGIALLLLTYAFFLRNAIADREHANSLLLQELETADRVGTLALEVAKLESDNEKRREALETLESRFAATPSGLEVYDAFSADIVDLGYRTPHYRPQKRSKSDGSVTFEGLDLSFRCSFRDCVALLKRWKALPYYISYDLVDVSKAPAGQVNVKILCKLGRTGGEAGE